MTFSDRLRNIEEIRIKRPGHLGGIEWWPMCKYKPQIQNHYKHLAQPTIIKL